VSADDVTVRKTKLSGRTSASPATVVQRASEGAWLFSPRGTLVRDPAGTVVWTQPTDMVQYFPAAPLPRSGGWYVACCWEVGPDPEVEMWNHRWISVDLAVPDTAPGAGPYDFVDLELDLWCGANGLGIVDEDELAEVEEAGLITAEVAETTRLAGDELYEHLAAGWTKAFGGVGWALLDRRSADF